MREKLSEKCGKNIHWKLFSLKLEHTYNSSLARERAGASHEYSCWNCILNCSSFSILEIFLIQGTHEREGDNVGEKRKIRSDFSRCLALRLKFFWLFKCRHHDLNDFFYYLRSCPLERQEERRSSSPREKRKCWEILRQMLNKGTHSLTADDDNVAMICEITEKKPEKKISLFSLMYYSRCCVL